MAAFLTSCATRKALTGVSQFECAARTPRSRLGNQLTVVWQRRVQERRQGPDVLGGCVVGWRGTDLELTSAVGAGANPTALWIVFWPTGGGGPCKGHLIRRSHTGCI